MHAASNISSLEHFIYSAIPGVAKGSGGKYSVNHADSKSTIVDYILTDSNLVKKASFIYLGAYTSNAMLSPTYANERYTFISPFSKDQRLPIIDPESSTGPFVHALLDEDVGTNLLAYDSYLNIGHVADLWSEASGQDATFMQVTVEMLQAQGVSREMLDAFKAMQEFGYIGGIRFIEPYDLKQKVSTPSYEHWLKQRNWDQALEDIRFRRIGLRKE